MEHQLNPVVNWKHPKIFDENNVKAYEFLKIFWRK